MKIRRLSERGQAMAETALFAVLAILMAFGLLAWIPTHRARTAATAAAYACTQFLSQSPDPARPAKCRQDCVADEKGHLQRQVLAAAPGLLLNLATLAEHQAL